MPRAGEAKQWISPRHPEAILEGGISGPVGWDSHGTSKKNDILHGLPQRCRETDQAAAALVTDLKQRGLLEDTIVIWGGEFGRP